MRVVKFTFVIVKREVKRKNLFGQGRDRDSLEICASFTLCGIKKINGVLNCFTWMVPVAFGGR